VLGSFEEWCRIIGGILNFAGIEGFLANLGELYRNSDPSMAAWEAFLSELLDQMPGAGFKTSDVVTRLRTEGNTLRAVLPEDLGDMDPLASFQRRLGRAFLKRIDRRYGVRGLYLIRLGSNVGTAVWGVREGKKL